MKKMAGDQRRHNRRSAKNIDPLDLLARDLSLEGSNHGLEHIDEETFVGVIMDIPNR